MIRDAWRAWQRFFFEPARTTTLGLVRIALGLVLLVSAYSWWSDRATWFARDGLAPGATTSPGLVTAALVVFVVAACCVTAGLFTRVSTVVAYVLLLAFHQRMPYVMNSGDLLLRLMLLLLCLAPAGAALSVDRWLRHRETFWESPVRPVWALRLMQLQLAVVYLATVWQKLRSVTWNNGLAMYYAFQQHDLVRVPIPDLVVHKATLINAMSWGVLATEVALALLVWNRRARPYVLAAGVVMHVMGHVFLVLSIFTYVVLASLLAFVPPETADAVLARARNATRRGAPQPTP